MTLEETLEKIHPADKTAMEAALAHWNNIAMPLHSLGRLQDTVVRIAGMTGNARVDLKKKLWWSCAPITVWWKKV